MTLFRRLLQGFRALFRRRRVEAELDAELRAYLDAAIDERMRAGMSRSEATRAARAEIGSLEAVKERTRDAGWESAIESFGRDLRDAVRALRRAPLFTPVAVLTLALGIGANSAIFTVVNGLLLRPLPVAEPQRLATLTTGNAINEGFPAGWTYPVWRQIRERADLFDGTFAWSGIGGVQFNLALRGEAEQAAGMFVSGEFFDTLGVPALLGRMLMPADDAPGGGADGPVAVISYGMWQRRFGGAADIVGRMLTLERVPFTIVGVTPPPFLGADVGQSFDVAVALATEPLIHAGGDVWTDETGPAFLTVGLRLNPDQSFEAATAALRAMQPAIYDAAHPGDAGFREEFVSDPFALAPIGTTSEVRRAYERPLVTLLAIVSLVLLIASANIANLLLSRAAARRRELGVRAALGASRWRLTRQLLVESALLAAAGASAGLLLASWGSRALVAQLSRFALTPVALDLSLDWRIILFTVATATLTMLLFGVGPAIRAARIEPAAGLRDDVARSASGAANHRVGAIRGRSGLLVAQLALSLILLVAAGLFVRTFERLAGRPSGFAADQVLIATVDASHTPNGERPALYARLIEAAASVPGVSHTAASPTTPAGGFSFATAVEVAGVPPQGRDQPPIPLYLISPGWFATYGSTILAGRDVSARDTASSEPVVLVNEAFARRFFPDGRVLGRQIRDAWAPPGQIPSTRTVVGLVGDSVLSSLSEVIPPTVYQPMTQAPPLFQAPSDISIGVRTSAGSPLAVAGGLAAALSALDRELAFRFDTLDDRVNASIAHERLLAVLAGFFSALALALAAVGLYGLTAYAAAQRRSEIGIRMAIGAQRRDVIALVLGRTLTLTGVGVLLGLAGAAALTRYLDGMLYEISPLDPITFATVPLLLMLVAAVAALVPARRAARLDPMIALRAE